MSKEVLEFNNSQSAADRKICAALMNHIDRILTEAESKIWHAHPVWFIDGNPIVGYSKLKDCTRLMFWSGQSFEEGGLQPTGSFKAAEVRYTDVGQIDTQNLQRWPSKSRGIQWDCRNIVKRKGELRTLK